MKATSFTPPSDEDISQAERLLGFKFSKEYILFIKSGYDLGDVPKDALQVSAKFKHLDLFRARDMAREYYKLPEPLLPICEDNADYYCLNETGEVVFWSHNGTTDEKWRDVTAWRKAMIAENED